MENNVRIRSRDQRNSGLKSVRPAELTTKSSSGRARAVASSSPSRGSDVSLDHFDRSASHSPIVAMAFMQGLEGRGLCYDALEPVQRRPGALTAHQ